MTKPTRPTKTAYEMVYAVPELRFVRAWMQNCASGRVAVVRALGLPDEAAMLVSGRASKLRGDGVRLPRMKVGRKRARGVPAVTTLNSIVDGYANKKNR